jgi:2-polyprenyl-3-methyl-5-hydroxy-6-metoxy-1,4-benzoquinol methylase
MRYVGKKISSACPVCGHLQARLYYTVTDKQSANHFIITTGGNFDSLARLTKKIHRLWNNNDAKVLACINCSFVYSNPFVAGDYEFYNLINHGEAPSDNNWEWEWEFEETRKSLSKIPKIEDLTLLEIGASTGNFIRKIADSLIKKEHILCTEYSEIGIEELKKNGITALAIDVNQLETKANHKRFDFICMFQVLEHLNNYEDLFRVFNYISKEKARVYIAVPNGRRIEFNEKNGGLLDLPPNHLARFNETTISLLANKFGWRINDIKIQNESYLDIMKGIMYYRSLQRLVNKKKMNKLARIIDYVDINLMKVKIVLNRRKIGDNLWVCLEKKEISK